MDFIFYQIINYFGTLRKVSKVINFITCWLQIKYKSFPAYSKVYYSRNYFQAWYLFFVYHSGTIELGVTIGSAGI